MLRDPADAALVEADCVEREVLRQALVRKGRLRQGLSGRVDRPEGCPRRIHEFGGGLGDGLQDLIAFEGRGDALVQTDEGSKAGRLGPRGRA